MSQDVYQNAGCSRVGVAVVLLVLGTGAALLIPGINRVRDAAARSSSICHAGCLVRVMHNFASASPGGYELPPGNWKSPSVPATGPFAAVLPYIETKADSPPDSNMRWAVSPADDTNAVKIPGLMSYTYNPAWLGRPDDQPGSVPFPSLDDCPDGLANTLLVAEQVMVCGGTPNPWSGNRGLDGVTVVRPGETARAVPPPESNFPSRWFGRPPCSTTAPSGSHHGLILVAMGDASVRAIALGVTANASPSPGVGNWQAAVTPAGKDVLGADW